MTRGFKAGVFETLMFYKHRRAALASGLLWPLLYLLFLYIGIYYTGRTAAYAQTVGVNAAALTRFLPAAGFLVTAAGSIVDGAVYTIQGLRWNGTLPYLLATPGALLRILTGYVLGSTMIMISFSALPFIAASAILAGPAGLIVMALVLLLSLAAGVAMIGVGALAASLALMSNRERMPTLWLMPLTILLSAVFYPPTLLPPLLRMLAPLIPLYHVSIALRSIATIIESKKLLVVLGVIATLALGYSSLFAPAALIAEHARRRSIE